MMEATGSNGSMLGRGDMIRVTAYNVDMAAMVDEYRFTIWKASTSYSHLIVRVK